MAKTQKECKEKLQRAIEENAKVDAIRAKQYTVGQWMDIWFENCAKIKVRPSSHKTYRGYIDNHIKPNIGKIPLNKLSSLDLQKLYKKLLNGGRVERIESKNQPKGLGAKTVRNINQVISSAMDFAIDQKLIAANPTDGCVLPKLEHREMKTLPAEQLTSFLREAKESGVDIKTVSSMLGHYSAGFTLDTYAHVTTAAQRQAANTMGSILSSAVGR